MTANILAEAEADLEAAFNYYEGKRSGLGREFLDQFRRGVDRILESPHAWPKVGDACRRYRLHRFPYGVVYRQAAERDLILLMAIMHLSQKPDFWRHRDT